MVSFLVGGGGGVGDGDEYCRRLTQASLFSGDGETDHLAAHPTHKAGAKGCDVAAIDLVNHAGEWTPCKDKVIKNDIKNFIHNL